MGSSNVSAVLFVKELKRVAEFYIQALGMNCSFSDDHHCVLNCSGFELIVHQFNGVSFPLTSPAAWRG